MKHVCSLLFVSLVMSLMIISSGFCSDKKVAPLTPEEMKIGNQTVHYPCAIELFNAAHVSGVQFKPDASNADISAYTSQVQRSLNLGRVISQAAVSVIAKDAKSLNTLADAIEGLGKTFGVSETIEEKKSTIIKFVQKNKWDDVVAQTMKLESWVKNEITSLRNPSAVVLANAGGMVSGLYYTTKAIVAGGSTKGSDILRQPELVKDLLGDLKALPASLQTDMVKKLINTLPKIETLVSVEKGKELSMDNIKKLETISGDLVAEISK